MDPLSVVNATSHFSSAQSVKDHTAISAPGQSATAAHSQQAPALC